MKNGTATTLKLFGAAALVATLTTGASAATFTWNGSGGLNGANYDDQVGLNPFGNGQADDVIIDGLSFNDNGSQLNLDGQDTYIVTNGVLRNTRNNKNIRGNSTGGRAVLDVRSGGSTGAHFFRDMDIKLSDDAVFVSYNRRGNPLNNSASIIIDSSNWTGSIFFGEYADAQDVIDNMSDFDRIFVDGVALTAGDLGTKFLLTDVDADTGGAPAITVGGSGKSGVDGFGVSLTLVPEPGSLALLGLGGLMMLRRRR